VGIKKDSKYWQNSTGTMPGLLHSLLSINESRGLGAGRARRPRRQRSSPDRKQAIEAYMLPVEKKKELMHVQD